MQKSIVYPSVQDRVKNKSRFGSRTTTPETKPMIDWWQMSRFAKEAELMFTSDRYDRYHHAVS